MKQYMKVEICKGGLNSKMGKNRLGEVAKEAFSSGVA